MIAITQQHGKKYITFFGKKVFSISESGVYLLPTVYTRPVQWSEIQNKPAAGIELIHQLAEGSINGANKNFSSNTKFDSVCINGLQQIEEVHFTRISDTSFQLTEAPLPGDIITVSFIQ